MKYRAVLFDMDGIIVDSEQLHAAAFQDTLDEFGHKISDEDYKTHFVGKTDETGLESYLKSVNKTVDRQLVLDEKARKYLELASDQLVPYPGVVQLIGKLASSIPLALVTGSLKNEAETALRTFNIIDSFKVIVTADDVSNSKPDPEGYSKAMELLEVSPKDCVVVEDSPSGVKAARAAGADCIAVTNTHTADELQEATIVVDKLDLSLFKQSRPTLLSSN